MWERAAVAAIFLAAGLGFALWAARSPDAAMRREQGRPNFWVAELVFSLPPRFARLIWVLFGLGIAALGGLLLVEVLSD